MVKRCRSEEEYQALIESEARALWGEREKRWPRHVQQTWEQGTALARLATINYVKSRLANGA